MNSYAAVSLSVITAGARGNAETQKLLLITVILASGECFVKF